MIQITLPDGSIKSFDNTITGYDVAMSISEGLARNCVAMELDSSLVDLKTVIEQDAAVRLITAKDPEALEIMRHTTAHVMAQAISRIYKNAAARQAPGSIQSRGPGLL